MTVNKQLSTIPICMALAIGLFGCADASVEQASEPTPERSATEDHAHVHADSGQSLVERNPGETFAFTNISREPVDFALLPILFGPERELIDSGELIEGTLRPGEQFTFDAAYAVADGYYTVDFALRVTGIGPDGARVHDEGQVEWRVLVASGRATTADNDKWLAAIMHPQAPRR